MFGLWYEMKRSYIAGQSGDTDSYLVLLCTFHQLTQVDDSSYKYPRISIGASF